MTDMPDVAPVAGTVPVHVPGRTTVEKLFAGAQFDAVRRDLIEHGVYHHKTASGTQRDLVVRTLPEENGEHRIVSLAAVSRDPGLAYDFVSLLADYQAKTRSRQTYVTLLWELYQSHGMINNAINKQSGLIATDGEFMVRKAKRGKARNAVPRAKAILHHWARLVNAPTLNPANQSAVITGSRGLQSITRQACRVALVEGSWVARHVWQSVEVPGESGKIDLPITIQTISTTQLEPVQELINTVAELFYWVPPQALLRQLRTPTSKELGNIVKRLIPKDLQKVLMKDNKVLLDPSLLMHVKHRGRDGVPFGESALECALPAVAYEQSILRLDVVSMQNLINRLTIVMIGSDDPQSPYAKEDVTMARASLMQSFFEDPGPNMTIIWAGNDVEVKDVGAHQSVLDLNERMQLARDGVRTAMGVPGALLAGELDSSKAAGWASMLGIKAQIADLNDQLENIWTTLGEQILLENGFTELEVEYNFSPIVMDDAQERSLSQQEYKTGLRSIRSAVRAAGLDPELEFMQRAIEQDLDPETATWEEVFRPVEGLQGQGYGGAPGKGRVPDNQTGKTTPERPMEKPSTTEQK